ncbi:hypothetical protein OH76DRAFT_1397195 [Lentinus brumalis]|uniref:Protein kinase domain-containing protein n=1 Tax=Lentinus brumalis TaxID=2498619 RepID=A0A371DQR9_9APHY|nr:hypothetical protein OH76DRAFT_1397195 [Polyporus brumalis]
MALSLSPVTAHPCNEHPLHWTNTPGGLKRAEYFWREHQKYLADCGYMLRPRYSKNWEPSWLGTKTDPWQCEDGKSTFRTTTMDAIRVADGRIVSLKQVKKSNNPTEQDIIRFFSEEPLASDPHNHSVPLYEVLQSPIDADVIFLVMPYLMRIYTVKFTTVGEVLECLRQLFQGLQFIHSNLVGHCDLQILNVMMDPTPLFSDMPHPAYPKKSYDFKKKVTGYTRTERPTKYYIIDFGLSRKFSPGDAFIAPTSFGGDRSVPEYKDPSGLSNPFPIDVYSFGNLIREDFLEKSSSVDFLKPLVGEMMREKPDERIIIHEAVDLFNGLLASMSERKLRSRYVYRKEFFIARI